LLRFLVTAVEVGNWPGEIEIHGPDLMEKFKKHALSFSEVTHKVARVEKIETIDHGFRVHFQNGETAEARTVILATGSNKRHLGVKGEVEFAGKGVTYCATCDAFFYRGKTVAVIGGGDSAVEGVAIAAQVAKTVYLIHRRSEFRAEPYWVAKVKEKQNIVLVLENSINEIVGDTKVTGVKLDKSFQGQDLLPVDGVFIEIGSTPATSLALPLGAQVDARGFLVVQPNQETSVPGLFAAGDVTNGSNTFAQFVTAAGEAGVAVNGVFQYLGKQ
jgi:thioredoxin reductase (NADPH)